MKFKVNPFVILFSALLLIMTYNYALYAESEEIYFDDYNKYLFIISRFTNSDSTYLESIDNILITTKNPDLSFYDWKEYFKKYEDINGNEAKEAKIQQIANSINYNRNLEDYSYLILSKSYFQNKNKESDIRRNLFILFCKYKYNNDIQNMEKIVSNIIKKESFLYYDSMIILSYAKHLLKTDIINGIKHLDMIRTNYDKNDRLKEEVLYLLIIFSGKIKDYDNVSKYENEYNLLFPFGYYGLETRILSYYWHTVRSSNDYFNLTTALLKQWRSYLNLDTGMKDMILEDLEHVINFNYKEESNQKMANILFTCALYSDSIIYSKKHLNKNPNDNSIKQLISLSYFNNSDFKNAIEWESRNSSESLLLKAIQMRDYYAKHDWNEMQKCIEYLNSNLHKMDVLTNENSENHPFKSFVKIYYLISLLQKNQYNNIIDLLQNSVELNQEEIDVLKRFIIAIQRNEEFEFEKLFILLKQNNESIPSGQYNFMRGLINELCYTSYVLGKYYHIRNIILYQDFIANAYYDYIGNIFVLSHERNDFEIRDKYAQLILQSPYMAYSDEVISSLNKIILEKYKQRDKTATMP